MASRDRYGGSFGSSYRGVGATVASSYRDDRRVPQKSAPRSGRKRSRSPLDGKRGESGRRGNDSRVSGGSYTARYEVQTLAHDFKHKELSVVDLKKRFNKMYVPSDFFTCDLRWMDCYLPNKPYQLGSSCNFHVFLKDVDAPDTLKGYDDASKLEPSDVDYSYSAKVMLLASSDLSTLYQHTVRVADEEIGATSEKLLWTRQLHFLVGVKGKNEAMAIGGPWSPSLDGEDPANNPQTLINTAIRTCRAQTGIDLSRCTRWHRFMEFHYFRPAERVHPTKPDQVDGDQVQISDQPPEPRVETVVIFFPDVHNCMPSAEEWLSQRNTYKALLETKLSSNRQNTDETTTGDEKTEESANTEAASTEKAPDATNPVHYSKLDVSTMKVAELRDQLDARNIDSKGLKSQLVSKLESALKEEERKDKAESTTKTDEANKETTEESAPSELSESERRRLERLYRLDENRPSILVHPSRLSRGGKFDCEKLSLCTLLEYRLDNQKEHTFEVSLFAEQFKDMIIRDASFKIYKALVTAPEPPAAKEADTDEPKSDSHEPDVKRRRSASADPKSDSHKRLVKRTVDPDLLFAFTVFDTGHAGYIKEEDMESILSSLAINLSRAQMRKLIHKITGRKSTLHYRTLTDKDIGEGDEQDVIHPRTLADISNVDFYMGNKAFFEEPVEVKHHLCGGTSLALLEKLQTSESLRYLAELSFGEISAELERTEKLLKETGEAEERFKKDIIRLSEDLSEDLRRLADTNSSNEIYRNLLKSSYDNMALTLQDIQRQFDEEKAAREAEAEAKRLAEEERKKLEEAQKECIESEENNVEQMESDTKDGEKAEDFTVLDSA